MATNYLESLAENKPFHDFSKEEKCPAFGKHRYFNLSDPEACCLGCGYCPRSE